MSTVDTDALARMAEEILAGYVGQATIDGKPYMAFTSLDLDADADYIIDGDLDDRRYEEFQRGQWRYVVVTFALLADDGMAGKEYVTVGAVESDTSLEHLTEILASLYAELTSGQGS